MTSITKLYTNPGRGSHFEVFSNRGFVVMMGKCNPARSGNFFRRIPALFPNAGVTGGVKERSIQNIQKTGGCVSLFFVKRDAQIY
jgi:hypothetical protein